MKLYLLLKVMLSNRLHFNQIQQYAIFIVHKNKLENPNIICITHFSKIRNAVICNCSV